MKLLRHVIKITIEGSLLFILGASITAGIVSVLPFSVFVDIEESGYLDQPAPVSELLFISKRTVLFDISASAIREVQRIDGEQIIQHPEVIQTTFVYETSSNGRDLIIPIPFSKFPIREAGLYSVSETVTLKIPVWIFTISKKHTFNNNKFNVL